MARETELWNGGVWDKGICKGGIKDSNLKGNFKFNWKRVRE